jgi:hypothetical protein
LIRRDQGGPFPFGQGHKATEASTTQVRASAAIAIFADQGCNIQAAPGGRGGGPQAREFITQGIVAAHRIAEQIAEALLQGETWARARALSASSTCSSSCRIRTCAMVPPSDGGVDSAHGSPAAMSRQRP